jgi:hemin uptake protein HemP
MILNWFTVPIMAIKPHAGISDYRPGRVVAARQADGPAQPRQLREIPSTELFGGGSAILIRHADEIYTLRRTRKGKLILTK